MSAAATSLVRSKPNIFVGSSSERLPIVSAPCRKLRQDAEVPRWDKNVVLPGRFAIQYPSTTVLKRFYRPC